MPRIPRYVTQVDVPGSVPYGQASPEAFAAPFTEARRGAQGLSHELMGLHEDLERVAEQRRKSQQSLQAFTLIMDARVGMDDAERAAREKNDHATYEQDVVAGYQQVLSQALAGTQDEEVRALVTRELTRHALEGRIKARTYATKLYQDQGTAQMDERLTVARDMILGTADPVERARLTGLALGAIRAQEGILYDAGAGQKKRETFERDLQEAQALLDMRADPETTEQRLLAAGEGFAKIAPDTRARLAGQARTLAEARERERLRLAERDDKAMAKALEADRRAQVDLLDEQADAGTLSYEALQDANRARVAVGEDYRRLLTKVRETGRAGGRTDDVAYNDLELRILERSLMADRARREIRALERDGKLAASGPRSAATLLRMVREEESADPKDITKNPLFDQGLDDIKQWGRGGKGALETLEATQATRLHNAIREYHDKARSGKFAPNQLPEEARKIVDRYLREQPQSLGDPELETRLRYRNPADLLKARQQGLIPEAEFNRQAELLRQLEQRQQRAPTAGQKGKK